MDPVAEWHKRAALFPDSQALTLEMSQISKLDTPEPYKSLLVHSNQMTATMERFYGASLDVRVLARRIDDTVYRRKIILVGKNTEVVVQFALAQFDLRAASDDIRQDILSEQIPLGRVLTNHSLKCKIEVDAILKVTIGNGLSELLQRPTSSETYGRMARLICDDKLTFEVIEILTPIGTLD